MICDTCNRPKDIDGNEMCLTHILATGVVACEDFEPSEKESPLAALAKELLECLNDEIKFHGDAAERTLVTIDKAIDLLY